jgi:hypothetical protein
VTRSALASEVLQSYSPSAKPRCAEINYARASRGDVVGLSRWLCVKRRLGGLSRKGFGMCQDGKRGAVGNAELLINIVQVDLYCTFGQP